MMYLNNLTFTLPHKTCFENFTATLYAGARIALIGQNGSGKSSLLKILARLIKPSEGDLTYPNDCKVAYVPQLIEDYPQLSGGERFQKALTLALNQDPDLLLLDEPTNHLDLDNRKSLMRLLNCYQGTLIIASHDVELLRNCIDTLWHIDQGQISVFKGTYDDYLYEHQIKRDQLTAELSTLSQTKKVTHQKLMHEQKRAKKSDIKGRKSIENRKWPTVTSPTKAGRSMLTNARHQKAIREKREDVKGKLLQTRMPEIIAPSFSLTPSHIGDHVAVSVQKGTVSHVNSSFTLTEINLSIHASARLAITGKNGSGKSTLLKAILNDVSLIRSGEWDTPKPENIGYLDQHYSLPNLSKNDTIIDLITKARPNWSHAEIRKHLNDFLFRKNEEVNADVTTLSGGEKARLSLALIAAKTPKLLLLDEITNNIDLDTREHVIQVLKDYPGAMIVISHDEDFLAEIGIEEEYKLS